MTISARNDFQTTSNPQLYRKAYKKYLETTHQVKCGYCPYHKWENASHTDHRSWKNYRKTQYKPH